MTAAPLPPLRPVTPLGIVAGTLGELLDDVPVGAVVDEAWVARLRAVHELAAGLEPYVARCTTPASPGLRRLEERTHAATHLEREMLSGHAEGQLLRFLVGLTGARRVLEIGMFTGYSALAMAEALPDDGRVVACEIDREVARFAQGCFDESPGGHKIVVLVGPAGDTLQRLAQAGDQFDLVFVDADKGGYADYLDLLLDSTLLAPGALVCVDNTLLQGEPYRDAPPTANGAAIAAFNRGVALDPRIEQVLVPIRDGLTLIRRV